MFGWIRASHAAQVQSPAVPGLGQVEMTLQQHANFVKTRFTALPQTLIERGHFCQTQHT